MRAAREMLPGDRGTRATIQNQAVCLLRHWRMRPRPPRPRSIVSEEGSGTGDGGKRDRQLACRCNARLIRRIVNYDRRSAAWQWLRRVFLPSPRRASLSLGLARRFRQGPTQVAGQKADSLWLGKEQARQFRSRFAAVDLVDQLAEAAEAAAVEGKDQPRQGGQFRLVLFCAQGARELELRAGQEIRVLRV